MKSNAIIVATATRLQEKETDSLVAVAKVESAKTNEQRCQQRRAIRRNLIVLVIVALMAIRAISSSLVFDLTFGMCAKKKSCDSLSK
jgi:hypothetical protein